MPDELFFRIAYIYIFMREKAVIGKWKKQEAGLGDYSWNKY
jgi:hypothetical protein